MYRIQLKKHFWASHSVLLSDGTNEELHSHNWAVTAELGSLELNDKNMVVDFCLIEQSLNTIIDPLINKQLSQNGYFAKYGETAEILAKYIFEKLELCVQKGVTLIRITVMEQPGCLASFDRSQP